MFNFFENGSHTTTRELLCTQVLQKTFEKVIILTMNVLISITAFLGNVLIIIALQKVTSLHGPSKLLFSCLAITDLCVGLTSGPISFLQFMPPQNLDRCYHATTVAQILGVILCGVSLTTLTAISVDRLLALMLRLRYRQVVTLRRVWALVFIIWLGSTCTAMIYLYNFSIFVIIVCILLLVMLVISSFCYLKIYLKLRQHQAQVQDHAHQGQPNGGGIPLSIPRYRKTVSSAVWIQSTILVCYVPYSITTAFITNSKSPLLVTAWYFTVMPILFNSTLNPLLHFWKLREVRQAVKHIIRKMCCSS